MPCPGECLRLCPLLHNRSIETKKKKSPNEQTDQSSRKKIQLSDKEVASLSDAQFKTLVIRMLPELVEYHRKLDEIMKALLCEMKENVQGTNSDGRKLGLKSMDWGRRKK